MGGSDRGGYNSLISNRVIEVEVEEGIGIDGGGGGRYRNGHWP